MPAPLAPNLLDLKSANSITRKSQHSPNAAWLGQVGEMRNWIKSCFEKDGVFPASKYVNSPQFVGSGKRVKIPGKLLIKMWQQWKQLVS